MLLPPEPSPGQALLPAGTTAASEYDFIESEDEDDDRVTYRSGCQTHAAVGNPVKMWAVSKQMTLRVMC